MTDRVLSTLTAKQTIEHMRATITGPLVEQIQSLRTDGQTLSDSQVWDGTLAREFREKWVETYKSLERTQQALEELRANIARINENIMTAGGN